MSSLDIALPTGRTIRFADEKAALFFVTDASAAGTRSYDYWIASGDNDPARITRGDLHAINTTMRARSSAAHWETFISADRLPWLAALRMDWDLITVPEGRWKAEHCSEAIREAMHAVNRPHLRAAATTKLLHIKRPALIPICDSYVVASMGMRAWGADTTTDVILAIRTLGRDNLKVLKEVHKRLQSVGIERTLARILDALLWLSAPSSEPGAYALFEDWLVRRHDGRLFF